MKKKKKICNECQIMTRLHDFLSAKPDRSTWVPGDSFMGQYKDQQFEIQQRCFNLVADCPGQGS